MLKTDYLFIDVNTQIRFVENFGEDAIFDCGSIRENLMNLTHRAREERIPIASLVYGDGEKVVDSLCEGAVEYSGDFVDGCNQYIFRHDDLEDPVSESLMDFVRLVSPRSIFVYGVPLASSVRVVCEKLVGVGPKVWVVTDCVKDGEEVDEEGVIEELKQKNCVPVLTHSLDGFVRL